ncbi:MAG: carotenoid biosynthesis protein [Promethearchaeota archaeon]
MAIGVEMNIVITYSLAVLVWIHGIKFRGIYKMLLLFCASIIIGGGMENINSIFGGYYYPGSLLTWYWGHCPFDIILGWFVIIYCCSYFSHILIGKGEGSFPLLGIGTVYENGIDKHFTFLTILRAALAGIIAVNLDMFIDPVAVENGWWIWTVPSLYIQGVPIANYLGWFFLIFWALVFYDLIITYCVINNISQLKTSAYWALGAIAAAVCATLVLSQVTLFFTLEGIRTESSSIHEVDLTFTPERIEAVIVTFIMITLAIVGIFVSSFAPNEPLGGHVPISKGWRVMPSIIMIIFWGAIMMIAIFTSPILIIIGLTQGLPLLLISLYIVYKPLLE